MLPSAFEVLGPVMVGPSSSHTAGALAIATMARRLCAAPPAHASFTLYGSFAHTGRGHGTDKALVAGLPLALPVAVVPGGDDRQASCAAGLDVVSSEVPLVAFHDGARPLVRPHTFEAVAARLRADASLGGAVAGCPCTDTVKVVRDGTVSATPDRGNLWVVQTPQAFPIEVIRAAHRRARSVGTDDASLVEAMGLPVAVVDAQRNNLKLTYPEDLVVVEAALLAAEREGE